MEHTCSYPDCTCSNATHQMFGKLTARNESTVTAVSFACCIFAIPHSVFVIVVFPPWKVTWRGQLLRGSHRAIMVGLAAMWCGTVQIITPATVYFHLSSLSFLWTVVGSTADRAEPPIEVNWRNARIACMHIAIILLHRDSESGSFSTIDCFFEWLMLFQVTGCVFDR